jgi:hypothetical protein
MNCPESRQRPPVNANDALLRVEACGICGSDIEQFHGDLQALGMTYPISLDMSHLESSMRSGISPRGDGVLRLEIVSQSNRSYLAERARFAWVGLTHHARPAP